MRLHRANLLTRDAVSRLEVGTSADRAAFAKSSVPRLSERSKTGWSARTQSELRDDEMQKSGPMRYSG